MCAEGSAAELEELPTVDLMITGKILPIDS